MQPTMRRAAGGAFAWLAAAAVLRIGVVPAETCDRASPDEITQAIDWGVGWLTTNQLDDGRFLYRYDADADEDLGGYNLARHGGLLVSLYQAHGIGIAGALETADQGLAYVLANTVDTGNGISFGESGFNQRIGGTALALAGLAERRLVTGDDRHDRDMAAMASFLRGQVRDDGAVMGEWDVVTETPVPNSYSKFFTGEAQWALALMHTQFPDDGWGEPAQRVMDYLATDRDDAEGWWPPIPDHWAAYGMAEMARWPAGRPEAPGVTDSIRSYAVRQAQLQSAQVRYESQRTNSTLSYVTRGRRTLGAGLGTIGEGFGGLSRLADSDVGPDLDRDALRERTDCTMALLVDRQISDAEAQDDASPERTRGAWFQFGITQMDDQQHSISALVAGANLRSDDS